MRYEISQEEMSAIKELLARVPLNGKEVPVYNRIMQILENPIEEKTK